MQNGRDHNPFGFTMWLAGGGIKGGITYGATDDFGFKAIEKPVHVHDLHATILHLMGIDHTKLTYRYSGRDFRLTDVSGTVLHDIIAKRPLIVRRAELQLCLENSKELPYVRRTKGTRAATTTCNDDRRTIWPLLSLCHSERRARPRSRW